MKLVNRIENVGHFEVYNDCVFVGRDTSVKEGMISHGNQILKISKNGTQIFREGEYFYFTAFRNGILFYVKEGDPIYYLDGKEELKFTPEEHYFSPLKSLGNRDEIIITQMDNEFNQEYFFQNTLDFVDKVPCRIFPTLSNESFYCSFHKKESWIKVVNKSTHKLEIVANINFGEFKTKLIKGEVMDKREKPFLDFIYLYIPLQNGSICKFNCETYQIEWVNREFGEDYVSYKGNSKYVFQHYGRGVNQIDKFSGETLNQVDFKDILDEKHHSTGRVWCSDKYVITKDLISGNFCVLDAQTLNPLALEFIMKIGFSEAESTFQIMNDKIYVLGMNNILSEYKMN